MELAKKTKEYSVFKKKSGRYGVKDAKGQWMKADAKAQILLKEGLIKLSPKKAAAEPAEEASAE